MELRLKSDTAKRKWFFTPESFSHLAKCHLGLLEWIVFTFTQEGDVVLDPMLGSGTTLYATLLGRSVIGVELENKFVKMAEDNLKKLNQMPLYLGVKQRGQAQIIQGDARNLSNILCDAVITSPPYIAQTSTSKQTEGLFKGRRLFEGGRDPQPHSKGQIGDLPYRQIDDVPQISSIITSPPYAEAQSGGSIAKHGYQGSKHSPTDLVGKRSYMPENIGGKGNISNLPYGQIDNIITSPPYEGSGFGQSNKYSGNVVNLNQQVVSRNRPANIARGKKAHQIRYADQTDANLGNLQGDTYLQAMLTVYHSCFTVLKPQGLMILVIRNFIRNKKEVDLKDNTTKLCEHVGFQFLEEHHRVLPGQSFWRTIYRRHHPDAPVIDREYILVFRR